MATGVPVRQRTQSHHMGTGSVTYVYDKQHHLISTIMLRQYDGYTEGHGVDLAEFLKRYSERYEPGAPICMKRLRKRLFNHIMKTASDNSFHFLTPEVCGDGGYQYHIYPDIVRVYAYDENGDRKYRNANWKTNEFIHICQHFNPTEDENDDGDEEKEEEDK